MTRKKEKKKERKISTGVLFKLSRTIILDPHRIFLGFLPCSELMRESTKKYSRPDPAERRARWSILFAFSLFHKIEYPFGHTPSSYIHLINTINISSLPTFLFYQFTLTTSHYYRYHFQHKTISKYIWELKQI